MLAYARNSYTLKVEAKYLQNRIYISESRGGLTASAVFLLSFFEERCKKPVYGVGCRSPPLHLDF
ncbi:hypothetical protein B5F08_10590 [Anaeromassilibacillus sp. An172]|nr:hypothetical protein B5F08_10590 [Anaeromassilibacillus sp. An172]